ncbi:MAG: hypothetical protein ABIG03_00280 [Candidatus Eisenbacteria bacterium]
MGHTRTAVVAVTAILLGAMLAGTASAVVTCDAVGEATPLGDGRFEYGITITWGLMGLAVPDRFDIVLAHLEECEYYQPGDPLYVDYLTPGTGRSDATPGCSADQSFPVEQIEWIGELRTDDADCWVPSLHIAFENVGSTESCLPLSEGSGTFSFTSFGTPLPVDTYYDVVIIKAGDLCLVCDYTGPLPDCNYWSPVENRSWGTVKALYR